MFVSDLRHFLDMPDDAPGPARKMAEHLGSIARAASAEVAGKVWESALPCRRRPGRRPCTGRIAVYRLDVPPQIEWRCTACGDQGVINGWEGSYFDLRPSRSERSRAVGRRARTMRIAVTSEVAATLRDLRLLDTECERLVFRARAADGGALLSADREHLEQLIGCVAAEANQEANQRRQQRLHRALTALDEVCRARGS